MLDTPVDPVSHLRRLLHPLQTCVDGLKGFIWRNSLFDQSSEPPEVPVNVCTTNRNFLSTPNALCSPGLQIGGYNVWQEGEREPFSVSQHLIEIWLCLHAPSPCVTQLVKIIVSDSLDWSLVFSLMNSPWIVLSAQSYFCTIFFCILTVCRHGKQFVQNLI